MEWNDESKKFEKCLPKPPPVIKVEASLMTNAHKNFSINCKEVQSTTMNVIADTGCQTTTCGMKELKKMRIPTRYLIPTSHGIAGITDTRLNIVGTVMMQIRYGKNVTHQMVYVANNLDGFYLSEKALVDIGLWSKPPQTCNESQNAATKKLLKKDKECDCEPRSPAPEAPEKIPFAPTEENKPMLESWLIDNFKASAFNTCTHQPLQEMTGEPMHIHFKPGHVPHAVHTPLPIPLHLEKSIKDGLDNDEAAGIIEKVPEGVPVQHCSHLVAQQKKNGSARRTVGYQKINKDSLRETHYTLTPFEIVSTLPTNTYKTVCDAWNGYHSMPLAEESRDATTFITKWGRYRYKRAPQGFHASGDAYTHRFDNITQGFKRVKRCVDDSILWDDSIEESFWHTYEYLKTCSDNGIVFNPEKFHFAKKSCEFAGFQITPDGYKPPESILNAIRDFPVPTSITDVRSWFGLINQVSHYFAQAKVMAPFRDLLSGKSAKFYWDDTLNQVFEQSKQQIISSIRDGVCTFQMNRTTCISTDWSKQGIGFTLSQKHCRCEHDTPICGEGHWKLIMAGSRFTRPAESRYAPIEGEALAVAWALQRCKVFVMGCPNLIVAVDHKPLIRILDDRPLESIENPRLLRLKEKMLPYSFRIMHIPGKQNCGPDVMSRYPTQSKDQSDDDEITKCATAYAESQSESLPDAISWREVNNAAATDEECIRLKETIQNGFPKRKSELHDTVKQFWPMRDDLYTIEHVTFKGKKMLIPKKLRTRVLDGLHVAHQGVTGMQLNARERLFWPGLSAAIKLKRDQCKKCNENAPSQHDEPLIITPKPLKPFKQVAVDFYQRCGHYYVIYADRYSGWSEVAKVKSTGFRYLKVEMQRWFQAHGLPEEISSDGGPPFNSGEYQQFLKKLSITCRMSSAYYAQSNGRAEVGVKTMKRILGDVNAATGAIDTQDAMKAILTHRNTPSQENGMSPSEMLYGQKLRDHLPDGGREMERYITKKSEKEADQKGRSLKPLRIGDRVRIQNQVGNHPKRWDKTGEVVEVKPYRQYVVKPDGRRITTTRNRKFLKKTVETVANPPINRQHSQLREDPTISIQPTEIADEAESEPRINIQETSVRDDMVDATVQQDVEATAQRGAIQETDPRDTSTPRKLRPRSGLSKPVRYRE